MITTLHIRNIGIIDDIVVNLNEGFNVLTGETGAGKTLIIDSLEILAGGRFSKDMIRKGENHSFVEACIYLPNDEKQIEGNVIISREIYANGRNLCKVNGRMVPVNELKEYMKHIIDIHGQHENQTILNMNTHIKYLDDFIGEEIKEVKQKYFEFFYKYNQIKEELSKNYGDDKQRSRKLDLLKYQIDEIEKANLKDVEEEELEEEKRILNNYEKVMENLTNAEEQITNNTIDSLSIAIKSLEKIEQVEEKYEKLLNNLKSVYYDIQEISRDISSYQKDGYYDEERKEQIEDRLDLIYSLKRKYGNTIVEILEYKEEIQNEIQTIENLEEHNKELKNQLSEIEENMYKLSLKMNEIRTKKAVVLEEKINENLKDLEMKQAKFKIQILLKEQKEYTKHGLNDIEFFIKTNIGDDAHSLSKIASGGEMSRIMLAIKTVLSDVDKIPILIFDEIDTGISGIASNKTAEKLKQISKNHQVLCVTHLAPIAAKGDYNYYISKEIIKDKTKTNIILLNEKQVLNEIARISSGTISDITIKHAQELRKIG